MATGAADRYRYERRKERLWDADSIAVGASVVAQERSKMQGLEEGSGWDEGVEFEHDDTLELVDPAGAAPLSDKSDAITYTLWLCRLPAGRRAMVLRSLATILATPFGELLGRLEQMPARIASSVSPRQMRCCVAVVVACGGTLLIDYGDP